MFNYADNPYLTALAVVYTVATIAWLKGVEHAEAKRKGWYTIPLLSIDPAHSCARCGSTARRDGGELVCSACVDELGGR